MDERLIGVDHLFQVERLVDVVGERRIAVERLVALDDGVETGVGVHHLSGEDAAREVTAVGNEVEAAAERTLHLREALANLGHMLMAESLVDAHVVVAPREMGRRTGLDAGAGRPRDGVDADVALEQSHLGGGQQSELDAGGEAAGIGHMLRLGDAAAVDFGQAIDEVVVLGRRMLRGHHLVGRQTEVLRQVDDLHPFGDVVGLHKRLALAMTEAEEHHVDVVERHVGGELQVGVAVETLVDGRYIIARMALAVGKGDGGLRVVDQQPDEFATRIAGGSEYSYSYHNQSVVRVGGNWCLGAYISTG